MISWEEALWTADALKLDSRALALVLGIVPSEVARGKQNPQQLLKPHLEKRLWRAVHLMTYYKNGRLTIR